MPLSIFSGRGMMRAEVGRPVSLSSSGFGFPVVYIVTIISNFPQEILTLRSRRRTFHSTISRFERPTLFMSPRLKVQGPVVDTRVPLNNTDR